MENQDIAANYRDENSQLVMISQSLSFFRGQFPLLFFFFNLWGAHIDVFIDGSYSSYNICKSVAHAFHCFLTMHLLRLGHAA